MKIHGYVVVLIV